MTDRSRRASFRSIRVSARYGRILFPQTLAGQLDKRIFERRPFEMDIGKLGAILLDPLHQVHHRSRRVAGLYREPPPAFAEYNLLGVPERKAIAIRKRLLTANLDQRASQR